MGQWQDEKSTKEFKKEVEHVKWPVPHSISLVLQNVYIFAVIENGSRPCWLLLYIRKKWVCNVWNIACPESLLYGL